MSCQKTLRTILIILVGWCLVGCCEAVEVDADEVDADEEIIEYEFIVTEIWDGGLNSTTTGTYLCPDENEYVGVDDGPIYRVQFAGSRVELSGEDADESMTGHMVETGGAFSVYALDIFAGGEFHVDYSGTENLARLDIFGSGVPTVASERGILAPVEIP